MLLAIDVRNTSTVVGLFTGTGDHSKLLRDWRIRTDPHVTADELAFMLRGLLGEQAEQITGVTALSTVPSVLREMRTMLVRYWDHVVHVVVEPGVRTGVPLLVDNPKEVGADRIVNTLAAHDLYDSACIVVDFGTTTCVDVVSAKGEFLGGAIAPGLEISASAMSTRTATLREVEMVRPRSVLGKNTVECIQAGTIFGFAGLVDGLVGRIRREVPEVKGTDVAVIGTGASGVQIIPRVQPIAEELTVFQRTPTWIMPHPDRRMSRFEQGLFKRFPLVQRIAREGLDLMQEALVPGFVHKPGLLKGMEWIARGHLRRQVRDRGLRAKLTPRYSFGCKRPTFSNKYYPALTQPNVEVVTDSIARVCENGIVTADGAVHEVDTIIMSTGFRMTDNPAFDRFRGQGGNSLNEVWNGDAQAYLGTTISGFPNFFFLLGPNSVVYTSQVVTIEAQVSYIVSCLQSMAAQGLSSIDVRPEVQQSFADEVEHGLRNSVWNVGGCSSYYLNDAGRNFVFYPGFNRGFRSRTRKADLAEYQTRSRHQAQHDSATLSNVRTS